MAGHQSSSYGGYDSHHPNPANVGYNPGYQRPSWSPAVQSSPSNLTQGFTNLGFESSQPGHGPGLIQNPFENTTVTSARTSLDYTRGSASILGDGFQMSQDPRTFFIFGRVFSCLWHEPVGATSAHNNEARSRSSRTWLGGLVYTNVQRFVVVRPRHDQRLSFCLPIKTYGGRGTTKVQSSHHAHSIIYTHPFPDKLPNEKDFSKSAIRMDPVDGSEELDNVSRLNFGKPTPVEHNIRVKSIGLICDDHLHRLLRYYKNENDIHSVDIGRPTPEMSRSYPQSTSVDRSEAESQDWYAQDVQVSSTSELGSNNPPPVMGSSAGHNYRPDSMTVSSRDPTARRRSRHDIGPRPGRSNTSPVPTTTAMRHHRSNRDHSRSMGDSSDQTYSEWPSHGGNNTRREYYQ